MKVIKKNDLHSELSHTNVFCYLKVWIMAAQILTKRLKKSKKLHKSEEVTLFKEHNKHERAATNCKLFSKWTHCFCLCTAVKANTLNRHVIHFITARYSTAYGIFIHSINNCVNVFWVRNFKNVVCVIITLLQFYY